MGKYTRILMGFAGVASTAALLPSIAAASFSDVASDHQYYDSIIYLQENEIVIGYPDGTFKPDQGVTRAEMMKIITLSAFDDEEIGDGEDCFPDVNAEWYARFVCYGQDNDIIKGYPDGSFQPNNNVTIAEGLKIGFETFGMSPGDESSYDRWYDGYIDMAHDTNLFSHYSILPDNQMTRAQMSYLVHQLSLDADGTQDLATERDSRSEGCFVSSEPSGTPDSIWVDGIERSYITAIGRNYDHDEPTKLVIAFHGRTSPNDVVRGYYGLEKAWDNESIIIYPAGLPAGSGRSRSDGGDASDELRDFALFDALVEKFSSEYCIDEDNIYVVGHSLGAWFTNSLSCARGDVIRATGSVGGSTTNNVCTGPVSSLIMHNPSDRLASFSGGEWARDQSVAQNGCDPDTFVSVGPAEGNCVAYTQCLNETEVVRCPHTQDYAWWDGSYYPHTWPDFAGEQIWDFFETHE